MAMGHTAGLCARLSMNNGAGRPGYAPSSSNRGVHTALMGDPTLRWPMVAPPWNVTVKRVGAVVALSWNASADTVIGYHVYRADQPEGPYTRLTREPVRTTSYGDPKPSTSKSATYIVRAAVLSSIPSGSFHNLSVGAVSQ